MVCITRMPERVKLLARSLAPVKSSAMQPSRMLCMARLRFFGQFNARENLDHGAIVLVGKACSGRLHKHLVGC